MKNTELQTANTGPRYWRSLEEYADTPQFRQWLEPEFAGGYDPDELLSLSRRRFLQLAAASLSLAGITLSGCRRWPEERLAPFAARPDGWIPGTTQKYATQTERAGIATGLLVTAFDGRPIKVDGNPNHPISQGACDPFAQASVLELYDPQRARTVRNGREHPQQVSWDNFADFAHDHITTNDSVAVLAEASASPSLTDAAKQLRKKLPNSKWYTWEPINRDNEIRGSEMAFGKPVRAQYDLAQAQCIACFDCDLLSAHPAALKYARQWAEGRRSADSGAMNRLYAVESGFSLTGSVADERLPVKSGDIAALVALLAVKLGVAGATDPGAAAAASSFIDKLATDLNSYAGRALVVVGPTQLPQTHALAWAINQQLGAIGNTVSFTDEPQEPEAGNQLQQITELAQGLSRGDVKTLLILGGNPVYDAPADLDFGGALDALATAHGHAIHLSLYFNETSAKCAWQLPRAHALECWGDGRAWDGTVSVQQPLILPLFEGKSSIELLALITGDKVTEGYEIVRRTMRANARGKNAAEFEKIWRRVLRDGVVANSSHKPTTVSPKMPPARSAADPGGSHTSSWEVVFYPSRQMYDGRHANNGWLQELPEPMTKTVWDNVALVNIKDARDLGVTANGDKLKITVGGRSIEVPAYLMPGQARGSIGLWLGYGRTVAGHIGREVGVDTYKIRTSDGLHIAAAAVEATGESYELALTQNHYLLDPMGMHGKAGRSGDLGESGTVIKEATLDTYQHDPHFVEHHDHTGDIPLQLWNPPEPANGWPAPAHANAPAAFNQPHAWGMSIDMNSCIGCGACIVACQAENNIAVVGKEQVQRHREMHWIRGDRYFKTDPATDPDAENPQVVHMTMLCQQCENAPCEQVCPVAATVHSSEGLNTMVYNRCIGTRYCSNNCPYKVRRFNYFDFHSIDVHGTGMAGIQAKPWLNMPDTQQRDTINEIKRMVFNPDVTIRMRGVMEKCTYCTQRIAQAKIAAKNAQVAGESDQALVQDGQITTACQDACPTRAIIFGDLNDPESKVSKLHANHRSYGVLTELNTRPRTRYLAKIRNPVPASPARTSDGERGTLDREFKREV